MIDRYQEWADAELVLDHEADPESFKWTPLPPPNKPKMNAPTVTPQQIEAIIGNSEIRIETIFDKVTLVSVRLPNGFVLTESSGAVSKENYDEKIGTEVCMGKIRDQIWKLEGYNLQERTSAANAAITPSMSGDSFGHALDAMSLGYRVARAGWNGKGMWVCKGEGNLALEAEKFWNRHTRAFAEQNGGTAEVLPYLIMKTADGKILMGWLASQSDMLATDWCVLPN